MSNRLDFCSLLAAHASLLLSVNLAQQLAAHAFSARLPARHHAPWSREDVDPHPTEHARNLASPHVHAASRTRHTLRLRNGRLVVGAIFQVNPDNLVAFFFRRLEIRDVALFFQDAGNLQLQSRSRNVHLLVPGLECIPHSRQHICHRIGQPHLCFSSSCPFAPRLRRTCGGLLLQSCVALELLLSRACHPERRCLPPGIHTLLASKRDSRLPTRTTSKLQESPRAVPTAGSKAGRSRTSAGSPADARRTCSGYACAWKTWASAPSPGAAQLRL